MIAPIIIICGMGSGFGIAFVFSLLSLSIRYRSRIIAFISGMSIACAGTAVVGYVAWSFLSASNERKAAQYEMENSYEHHYPEDKGVELKFGTSGAHEESIDIAAQDSGGADIIVSSNTRRRSSRLHVANMAEAVLPPHAVYIRAKRTDSGAIAKVGEGRMNFAEEVHLCASSPEDGFIAFEAKHITHNPTWDLRSMKQCPSGGYTNSLLIQRERDKKLFFFCKLGTKYGKGYITRELRVQDNKDSTVRCLGNLYLLYDGTASFIVNKERELLTR
jgi:hypothetical protein